MQQRSELALERPQVIALIHDTYAVEVGSTSLGVVTGKPIRLGASVGREDATSRGCFFTCPKAPFPCSN